MCHSTEMKHDTIFFLHFTQLTSRNTSLTRVNANFKRMEITNLYKQTSIFIEYAILYKITLGHLNNLL